MTTQPGPELRIGDAERDAAVTALGEHYAAGRLTKDEYDERAGQAFAARTESQLWPLFADLPRPQGAPGYQGRPGTGSAGASARPGRPQAWADRPGPGRGGWWLGPVLAVILALVVLTHLPVILLVVLLWFVCSRMLGWRAHRHWSDRHWSDRHWSDRHWADRHWSNEQWTDRGRTPGPSLGDWYGGGRRGRVR